MMLFGVAVALIALLWVGRKLVRSGRFRTLVRGLVAVDVVIVLLVIAVLGVEWLVGPGPAAAMPAVQQAGGGLTSGVALAAALSTGLAALASGIAVAVVGSAAVGAVSEEPENLGRTLIFVGLAEGIAIYGLITSFLILTR